MAQVHAEELIELVGRLLHRGERHALQRGALTVRGVGGGVADDGERGAVRLRAVAEGVFHGDLAVQSREDTAELPGEAAVIALCRRADDADAARADDGIRLGARAREGAGVVRAADIAEAVAALHRAAAGAREAAGAALAADVAVRVAVVDVAAAVTDEPAGDARARDGAEGGALRDGAAAVADKTAGGARARDGHVRGALVDGTRDGEERVLVGLTFIAADKATGLLLAGDGAADGAAADEVCLAVREILTVELGLRIADEPAGALFTRDGHVREVQILDRRALDDAEEADVLRPGDGHARDGVALSVEQAGERVRGGADAGEVHAAEVKIRRQAVVLREHAVIAALRERQQVCNARNVDPLDALAAQLRQRRALEAVFGRALEPENGVAVLHGRERRADVRELVVDGEHPAVGLIDGVVVDGVDKPAEGRGRGVGVGELALRLRGVHEIHKAGVACGIHGDGDVPAQLAELIGLLVIRRQHERHGDAAARGLLGCGHALQIR